MNIDFTCLMFDWKTAPFWPISLKITEFNGLHFAFKSKQTQNTEFNGPYFESRKTKIHNKSTFMQYQILCKRYAPHIKRIHLLPFYWVLFENMTQLYLVYIFIIRVMKK